MKKQDKSKVIVTKIPKVKKGKKKLKIRPNISPKEIDYNDDYFYE
jgi:hypothetical protein